jgi:hypothetical protein
MSRARRDKRRFLASRRAGADTDPNAKQCLVLSTTFLLHSRTAIAFAKWAAVCRTNGLRTGLIIAAERAAYHARVIQRRTHELGAELRSTTTPNGVRLIEALANGAISDLDKLAAITSLIQDPQQVAAPLLAFRRRP